MIYKPKDYQRKATKFIINKNHSGIFADPGLGKTVLTLSAIRFLLDIGEIDRVLIIAPILVCYNVWPQEIEKWNFKLTHTILHGKKKNELLKNKTDIHLINPEGLFWFFSQVTKIKKRVMLVIDESSKFKNPSGKRFKLLKKFIPQFKRRVILTGTPAPNSLMDLFSQIFIIDRGKTFGRFITHFRNHYFYIVNPKFYTYAPKEFAEKDIQKKTAPLIMRINQKDWLDLPDIIYNYIRVRLPHKAQKNYDEIEKEFLTQIDDQQIHALNAGSAYRSLHQIANGGLYSPLEQPKIALRRAFRIHDIKTETLKDLTSELQGKPLLCAYMYHHDLARIRAGLGMNIPYIGQGVDTDLRTKYLIEWNAKKIPLLLVQIATVSHGVNLQAGGNDLCFYSLTDDLEAYEQLIRRLYRQGITGAVRIHHIIAKNTVDEAILIRLRRKSKRQNALLDAIQEYRKQKGF